MNDELSITNYELLTPQYSFTNFVQTKGLVQKSFVIRNCQFLIDLGLAELDDNFNALMQKAFKGEL